MGANQSKGISMKRSSKGGQVLGGGSQQPGGSGATGSEGAGAGSPASSDDPRVAAAEAAERRLKAQQARGTNASNPKQGQLAAQAARANSKTATPSNQNDDRLVWD